MDFILGYRRGGDRSIAAFGFADLGTPPFCAEFDAGLGTPSTQRPGFVVAPCKGRDLNLEDNLRALLEQDYDDYEVSFIVESVDDPACAVIRRAMAAHPWMSARMVVAGRASDSGQKVHNLRVATARLSPRIEYLAFADSDARPRPEWLRMLISRLYRPHIGAMTGYRWFVPEGNSAANKLLYSLNCNVMSLLGGTAIICFGADRGPFAGRCSIKSDCVRPGKEPFATTW